MNTPLRTLLLALCIWAVAPNIHAQSTADSLRRLILPASDDTLKVRRLVELVKILTDAGKYDSALAAANWAQMLAERLKYQKGLADALLQQGTVYHKQSQLQTALEIYKQSLAIAEQQKDKQVLANILNNLGRVHADKSQYPSALEYLLRSLKIREELGEKQGLVGVLNNIGILYYFQAEYSSAFAYYNKALKISEESGNKRGISSSLLNLGDIYLYDGQKRFAEALATYQKSLVLKQEIDDKRGISICQTCIGNSFTALGQLDSALFYQNQAYNLASEVNNQSWMAFALHGTAIIRMRQGKYAQALPKAQEALEFRIQFGERKEANESQALLATIHAALGNYKAAYTAQREYHALKDSLFNADNAKRLATLQADYDAQKRAAEEQIRAAEARHKAELAAQEKERQTQLQYAAIAGVVLFVLALALASRRVSTDSAWGQRFGRFVSFAAVVMLVEFAILFLDPWLDRFTGGTPLWRMAANVCIAVVVTPVHGLVEARLRASRREAVENEV